MHHRSNALAEDAMIAATAQLHGLQVVTRNISDFKGLGIRTFNPWTHR
jgi:toxin FitB